MKIEGEDYKVIENLGFVHSRGCYAKVVQDGDRERVVIKEGGLWQFAKPGFRTPSDYRGMNMPDGKDK